MTTRCTGKVFQGSNPEPTPLSIILNNTGYNPNRRIAVSLTDDNDARGKVEVHDFVDKARIMRGYETIMTLTRQGKVEPYLSTVYYLKPNESAHLSMPNSDAELDVIVETVSKEKEF